MRIFKRKAYQKLLEWKKLDGKYAILIEGARRVGKSTLALEFAKNEYDSYILIDFAKPSIPLDIFDEIYDLNRFFLRLQTETGVSLKKRKSVIIFDEVQLYPKARQAIKMLVADNRYDYIETGSLISIKKNVEGILIPSEELKLQMYPLDYEEFLWATGKDDIYNLYRQILKENRPIGDSTNAKLMKDFRMYMAIGGMPQAIETYLDGGNFNDIDLTKKAILSLYYDDFVRIDPSGRIGMIYNSIPSQLASNRKRFVISNATHKKKTSKDEELFNELVNSKTVLPCFNVTDPSLSLNLTRDLDNFKLYLCDIGLFVTLMFNDSEGNNEDIYVKLLRDKLSANLGYLYENAIAQTLNSNGYNLYYHTWNKKDSTHYYEVDFLFRKNNKIIPIEVKSGNIKKHESIDEFCRKYSNKVGDSYLISQHDISRDGMLKIIPIYLAGILFENKQ